MNPLIPIDKVSGPQDRTKQVFFAASPLISLPDKDELSLILRLNQIHKDRQNLPRGRHKRAFCLFPRQAGYYEKI